MSNDGDALIREVEEELRREKLAKLWQDYGMYLVAGAVAIVVSITGYQIYQARSLAAAQSAGSAFETALDQLQSGKTADGVKVLESLAKGGHSGYATLSRLRLAGQYVEDKKPGEAIKYYEQVAKDTNADQIFRDLAVVRIAALKLGEESWTETKNRLTEVVKTDRPWRLHALELIGLAAYRTGKYDEARQALAELVGKADVPPSLSQRAQIVLGLITAKEVGKSAPAGKSGKASDGAAKAEKPANKK